MSPGVATAKFIHSEVADAPFVGLKECLYWVALAIDDAAAKGIDASAPLLLVAATTKAAVVLKANDWPDADGLCDPAEAKAAVTRAIENSPQQPTPEDCNTIIAGWSLLLGEKARALQLQDTAALKAIGEVPLTALLINNGVALTTTVVLDTYPTESVLLH